MTRRRQSSSTCLAAAARRSLPGGGGAPRTAGPRRAGARVRSPGRRTRDLHLAQARLGRRRGDLPPVMATWAAARTRAAESAPLAARRASPATAGSRYRTCSRRRPAAVPGNTRRKKPAGAEMERGLHTDDPVDSPSATGSRAASLHGGSRRPEPLPARPQRLIGDVHRHQPARTGHSAITGPGTEPVPASTITPPAGSADASVAPAAARSRPHPQIPSLPTTPGSASPGPGPGRSPIQCSRRRARRDSGPA